MGRDCRRCFHLKCKHLMLLFLLQTRQILHTGPLMMNAILMLRCLQEHAAAEVDFIFFFWVYFAWIWIWTCFRQHWLWHLSNSGLPTLGTPNPFWHWTVFPIQSGSGLDTIVNGKRTIRLVCINKMCIRVINLNHARLRFSSFFWMCVVFQDIYFFVIAGVPQIHPRDGKFEVGSNVTFFCVVPKAQHFSRMSLKNFNVTNNKTSQVSSQIYAFTFQPNQATANSCTHINCSTKEAYHVDCAYFGCK